MVDYDSINGIVRAKETAQGFAHESAWARGQAWGIYGYTVCFRYTKDSTYLNKAKEIVNFVFSDENIVITSYSIHYTKLYEGFV